MRKNEENKVIIPRYQQIAIEIASRIAREEYVVGQKIYARSSIAGQYGVSPETARRAISLLSDLEVVTAEKGSGVTIKSQKKAAEFIKQNNKRQTIETIKENLLQSVERQQKDMEIINNCLTDLIAASEHFRSMNPLMPFIIKITDKCAMLNKTISEIQFWQHTSATVLAVRRHDTMIKSPGPYIVLQEDDIIYFLPQEDSPQNVKDFLYPQEKSQ